MQIIAVTGGLGTGKSTVARLMNARFGFPVIDADELSRWAFSACSSIISRLFPEALAPDSSIDRRIVAEIVFSDARRRRHLNQLLHPLIIAVIAFQIIWHWLAGASRVVIDAPLLFEVGGGLVRICRRFHLPVVFVLVACDANVQIARAISRDGATRAAIEARIDAQMPMAEKQKLADRVIENIGDLVALDHAVGRVVEETGPGFIGRLVSWIIWPPLIIALLVIAYRLGE